MISLHRMRFHREFEQHTLKVGCKKGLISFFGVADEVCFPVNLVCETYRILRVVYVLTKDGRKYKLRKATEEGAIGLHMAVDAINTALLND